MRPDARRHLLAITLVVGGIGLGQAALWLRPTTASYQVHFSDIPMEVLGLKGCKIPNDPAEAAYLQADAMLSLRYGEPPDVLNVSAIYGAGWRTVHTPEGCFPAHGWRIVSSKATEIPIGDEAPHTGPLHARLMRVERDDEVQLVLFVFAHKGGTHPGWKWHSFLVQTATRGAGGLLLRITAPATLGQESQVEELMDKFMRALYPHAVKFWYAGDVP